MEEDKLVLITFKLKAKQQLMVVALLRANLFTFTLTGRIPLKMCLIKDHVKFDGKSITTFQPIWAFIRPGDDLVLPSSSYIYIYVNIKLGDLGANQSVQKLDVCNRK